MVVVALGLTLTACGDDDGIPIEDLEDEVFSQVCERMVRCGAYVDVASCRAELILADDIVRGVQSGRILYDPELAAECLAATEGASCDRTTEQNRVQIQACRDALNGTIADGGACFNDQECVSEDCVVETCTMACCQGVCGPTIALAAIGQSCEASDCVEGAYCDQNLVCAALLPAGSPCDGADSCAYGLICGAAGCTDAPDRGQACPDQVCAGIGDRCDEGTCVGLSARGGPCSGGFVGFLDCQRPLVCNDSTLVCEDPPTVGQTCNFSCAPGAFCNEAGSCEAQRANGAACMSNNECASRYCDDFAASPVCADEPVCG